MNVVTYWNSKKDLLDNQKNIFEGWNSNDEKTVRKIIISKMMDITIDNIPFYLNRDEWLKNFSHGDVGVVDSKDAVNESFNSKANNILIEKFYSEDAKELQIICDKNNHQREIFDKSDVCNLIKKLLLPETLETLSPDNKRKVELYEKIYFEPIELINEYIRDKAGAEVYYTVLMEQWKTANEMAANISEQRNNMNNFYMSLMSILIGGILFSDQLLSTNIIAKTVLFLTIAVIGVFVCKKWRIQIDNYGRLNGAKYEIINELERNLSANVMYCEWLRSERNARKQKKKVNFSEQEKGIAKLFEYVVLIVPIVMLVGTWWDEICNLIQMVVWSLK